VNVLSPFAIVDLTTDAEYRSILNCLPPEIAEIIEPNIRQMDEIILDVMQPLSVRCGDLRIDYPFIIDPVLFDRVDAQVQSGVAQGWRSDGRIGIPGTLHRISRETNLSGKSTMITVRLGRALFGVAEPLREVLMDAVTRKYGIAIIGAPAAGKTTLLRDIARIMAERMGRGLVIIDTSNEIAGDSDVPHPIIGKARRVTVGDPALQAGKFARTVGNMGPQGLLSDEIGYRDDIPIIVTNAPRGVSVTATLHGENLHKVVKSQNLWPLLGIIGGLKVDPAIFPVAIEVVKRGHFRVHRNFDESISALLGGETPTVGVFEILPPAS